MAGIMHLTPQVSATLLHGSIQFGQELPSEPATPTVKQHGFEIKVPTHSSVAAAQGHVAHSHWSSSVSLNGPSDAAQPAEASPFAGSSLGPAFTARHSSEEVGTPLSTGFKGLLDLCNATSSYSTASVHLEKAPSTRIEVVGTAHVTPGVKRLVKAVERGLLACQEPEAAEQGLGGTYFFCNESGRKVAIVKPCDEEPLAPNNPKGFVGRQLGDLGLKPTVRVGEAAMREVAAYLLDHDHFAKVPHTAFVRVAHPIFHIAGPPKLLPSSSTKTAQEGLPRASSRPQLASALTQGPAELHVSNSALQAAVAEALGEDCWESEGHIPSKLGSMQEFVVHDCDTSELGPSRFSTKDVHRIGLLDIRLFNTDRHGGNMLVRKPQLGSSLNLSALTRLADAQYELVPIDHGFCLPEALEAPYFEWLYWPQAMIPFDDEELDYINKLDPKADVDLLQRHLPMLPLGCLRTLTVSTTLLKRCAAAGLTLSEIGSVCSRSMAGVEEEPSDLEKLCAKAREVVDSRATDSDSQGSEVPSDCDEEELLDAMNLLSVSDSSATNAAINVIKQQPAQPACLAQARGVVPLELVFALDEEAMHTASALGSIDVATNVCYDAAHSPESSTSTLAGGMLSSFSPDNEAASSNMLHSATTLSAAARGELAVPGRPMCSLQGATGGAALAKSFCPAQGAALAGYHAPKPHTAAVRRLRRRSHGSNGKRKAKYPPLVRGSAPDSVNLVFDGLTDLEWADFLRVFEEEVDAAISAGRWKEAGSTASKVVPMSLPF